MILHFALDVLYPPDDDAASPQEGTDLPQIPGYEVQSVLGRGGMGIVFRARHVRLNRDVALKMLLAGGQATPEQRQRIQREAETVASLKHPNIVQVHDIGDRDGQSFFTMEYLEGGSLAGKLANMPHSTHSASQLIAILAGAVQAAHACGIVHCDLKPGNILFTQGGKPKVIDFGLAHREDDLVDVTEKRLAVGTPSYMAPEQAQRKFGAIGPAVDIYALGAILYELLTGRPPFRAATSKQTVRQVIHQEPEPPSRLDGRVPNELETICLKCLNKRPTMRYATAAELAEDLRRYLRSVTILARSDERS